MRLSLFLLLAACGSDPVAACEAYLEADAACAAEAWQGTVAPELGGGESCDCLYGELGGKAAKVAVSGLGYFAETLDEADCSTPQAYFEAVDAACACEDAPASACETPES